MTDGVGYLTSLLHDNAVESDTESEHAYAASTLRKFSPNRSTHNRGSRGRGKHDRKGKACPSRDKSRSVNKWKDNPCRHCCKFKRDYQHDSDSATCFYNKKYKGW